MVGRVLGGIGHTVWLGLLPVLTIALPALFGEVERVAGAPDA